MDDKRIVLILMTESIYRRTIARDLADFDQDMIESDQHWQNLMLWNFGLRTVQQHVGDLCNVEYGT